MPDACTALDFLKTLPAVAKDYGSFFFSLFVFIIAAKSYTWYNQQKEGKHVIVFLIILITMISSTLAIVIYNIYNRDNLTKTDFIHKGTIYGVTTTSNLYSEDIYLRSRYEDHTENAQALRASIEFIVHKNSPFTQSDRFRIRLSAPNGKQIFKDIRYSQPIQSYYYTADSNGLPTIIPEQEFHSEIYSPLESPTYPTDHEIYPAETQRLHQQLFLLVNDINSPEQLNRLSHYYYNKLLSQAILTEKTETLYEIFQLESNDLFFVLSSPPTICTMQNMNMYPVNCDSLINIIQDYTRHADGYISSLAKRILEKGNGQQAARLIVNNSPHNIARYITARLGADFAAKHYNGEPFSMFRIIMEASPWDNFIPVIPSTYNGKEIFVMSIPDGSSPSITCFKNKTASLSLSITPEFDLNNFRRKRRGLVFASSDRWKIIQLYAIASECYLNPEFENYN